MLFGMGMVYSAGRPKQYEESDNQTTYLTTSNMFLNNRSDADHHCLYSIYDESDIQINQNNF